MDPLRHRTSHFSHKLVPSVQHSVAKAIDGLNEKVPVTPHVAVIKPLPRHRRHAGVGRTLLNRHKEGAPRQVLPLVLNADPMLTSDGGCVPGAVRPISIVCNVYSELLRPKHLDFKLVPPSNDLIRVLVPRRPLELRLPPALTRPQPQPQHRAPPRVRRARHVPHPKGAPRDRVTPSKDPQLVLPHLARAERERVRPLRHVRAVARYVRWTRQVGAEPPHLVHPVLEHLSV
mmetsp:Transcript_2759/g.6493  ORF Transcript_2759/g.6493 Transcript_2759/m.6493 type:complete len:231 (-) Transcript_2759:848-1540(-)